MRHAIQATFFLIAVTFVNGCDYGSEVPLGTIDQSAIDMDLLGEWTCVRYTSREIIKGDMILLQFNDREYYIEMSGMSSILSEPDKPPIHLIERDRAYSTEISGTKFLNVQQLRLPKSRRYVFYSYSMPSPDELIIKFVDMSLFSKDLSTIAEARRIVEEKINDPDLYEADSMKCQRVQDK